MSQPWVFLAGTSPAGTFQIVSLRDSVAQVYSGPTANVEYGGLAHVLFDPEDRHLPWRTGDLLFCRVTSGKEPNRELVRLRAGKRPQVYEEETLCADSSTECYSSLGLDARGRLYAGLPTSLQILLIEGGAHGSLRPAAWLAIPASIPWGGDFAFSADGRLYLSTGPNITPGRIFKTLARPEKTPAPGPVGYRVLYENATGPILGFGFEANDRVIFATGSTDFRGDRVDATLAVSLGAPSPPFGPPPTLPPDRLNARARYPGPQQTAIRTLAMAATRWQRYLGEKTTVRSSIGWNRAGGAEVRYDNWANEVETADFNRILHRFYGWTAAREPMPYAFSTEIDPNTNALRVGPELVSSRMSHRDAAEMYLATLAHILWTEVTQQLPWRLADYSLPHIQRLVHASFLFTTPLALERRRAFNGEELGAVAPTDPVRAFDLMTGKLPQLLQNSLVRTDASQTMLAFTRWVMDNFNHGGTSGYGPNAIRDYGYAGPSPLEAMYERRVNPFSSLSAPVRWAWHGCHSMGGFMSHMARLLLIPGERLRAYDTNGGYHYALNFPTLDLMCWHVDDFYATPALTDFHCRPEDIYNGGVETYQQYRARAHDVPVDIDAKWASYMALHAQVAIRRALKWPLDKYWVHGRFEPLPSDCADSQAYAVFKQAAAQEFGLTPDAVAEWFCPSRNLYDQRIADFEQSVASQLNPGTPEERSGQARDLYCEIMEAWVDNRGK